jgi:hypothetical protein
MLAFPTRVFASSVFILVASLRDAANDTQSASGQ